MNGTDLIPKDAAPFSVKEYEEKIVSHYGDKERIKYFAEEFRSAEIINGTSLDFLHFALSFMQNGDNQTACEVLRCGIKKYPYDAELLACFLSCAIDSGNSDEIKRCKEFHDVLKEIPMERYSERAFNSTLKYLSAKRNFEAPKEYEKIKEEAKELISVFNEIHPSSEGSYFSHCEFLDRESEKISKLKEAVSKLSSCPRCALRLADILCDRGEYREADETINRCLNSIQTLSKVNRAYAYYLQGVCKYGILVNDGIDRSVPNIEETVNKIYESFRIAKSDYFKLQATYRREIDKIIFVLEQQLGIMYS
jgi:tetratricopeptide (TPR) repeat protein